MSESAIFKDCAFPDDCECAKRGYDLERDSCAVPGVAAAAASLGLKADGLFGDRFRHPIPALAAIQGGTAQPLPNSGDLAKDVIRTLRCLASGRLAPACPYDRDGLDRIISYGKASRSLRAEAGYGSSGVELLFSASETLKSGKTLLSWIVLGRTEAGDALYWMLLIRHGELPLIFGDERTAERATDLLVVAGGGSVGDRTASWTPVPSEEEINGIG